MHTLEQIQEYNRKTINHLSEGENITLSKVLLALEVRDNGKTSWGDPIGYFEGSLIYLIWFDGYCGGYDKQEICDWDLTKETLEEQEEETQDTIFRLLEGYSKCEKYPPEEMSSFNTRDALEDLCNFNKE